MARRTDFQAATTYTGQKIKGPCVISYKIDGVRILYRNGKFVTRNDKVSPGFDQAVSVAAKAKIKALGDCEIYKGDFHRSNSPLQRHNPEVDCIGINNIFPLVDLDDRLYLHTFKDGLAKDDLVIKSMLINAVKLGYEGLVIRTSTHWYRVKPSATADVFVTGWFEQLDKDKNPKGQLGGFNTNYGKVTAFSDEMRQELWVNPDKYLGELMQVTYKERYHTGKFRYCVTFNHFRPDKDTESFDTEPPIKE